MHPLVFIFISSFFACINHILNAYFVCLAPCIPFAKPIKSPVTFVDGMRGAMHAYCYLNQWKDDSVWISYLWSM